MSHYVDLLRRHCKLQALDVVRAAKQLPLRRSLFTADQLPRSDKTLGSSFFSLGCRSAKHRTNSGLVALLMLGFLGFFGNS